MAVAALPRRVRYRDLLLSMRPAVAIPGSDVSGATTAIDVSGNVRPATYTTGTAVPASGAIPGEDPASATLSSSIAQVASASWSVQGAQSTVMAWCRTTATGVNQNVGEIGDTSDNNREWRLMVLTSNVVEVATWDSASTPIFVDDVAGAVTDGQWHFLVQVSSMVGTTGTVKLVRDGNVVASASGVTTGTWNVTQNAVSVGSRAGGGADLQKWGGSLAWFAYWPTLALGLDQIRLLYRCGLGQLYRPRQFGLLSAPAGPAPYVAPRILVPTGAVQRAGSW